MLVSIRMLQLLSPLHAYQFPRIHIHTVTRFGREAQATRVTEDATTTAPRLLRRFVRQHAVGCYPRAVQQLEIPSREDIHRRAPSTEHLSTPRLPLEHDEAHHQVPRPLPHQLIISPIHHHWRYMYAAQQRGDCEYLRELAHALGSLLTDPSHPQNQLKQPVERLCLVCGNRYMSQVSILCENGTCSYASQLVARDQLAPCGDTQLCVSRWTSHPGRKYKVTRELRMRRQGSLRSNQSRALSNSTLKSRCVHRVNMQD